MPSIIWNLDDVQTYLTIWWMIFQVRLLDTHHDLTEWLTGRLASWLVAIIAIVRYVMDWDG